MAETNFKVFNEEMSSDRTFSDAEYSQATQRQGGVIPGMALSRLHNKLYRQSTAMAKAIADFLVAQGYDCNDNDVPGITTALQSVILALAEDAVDTHSTAAVLDHPNNSVTDVKIGNRTITDTTTAAAAANTLTNLLGMVGYMLKNITGKSNWYTLPATTIQAISDLIVTAATANKLLKLDANGKLPADITGNAATATTATNATNATNHISAASGAHAASAISSTATGGISATNVQAAIAELAAEKAPIASPTFTGTVTAPALAVTGAATGTSFNGVTGLSSTTPAANGIAAVGTGTTAARADHAHPAQTSVSGNAGTATKLATVRTINGVGFDGSANITVYDSTKAPLASPALTGTPTAPTAPEGTNTTQIATTAFVQAAFTSIAQPGDIIYTARSTAPPGTIKANGAAVNRTTYNALDAAIYVGDANNNTALFGYRCTDPANPSTTRSTTGPYIVTPDLRGEFTRGWDDGRGVDTERAFGSSQTDAVQNITGFFGGIVTISQTATGAFAYGGSSYSGVGRDSQPNYTVTFDASRVARTSTETRPRNIALLACIKY